MVTQTSFSRCPELTEVDIPDTVEIIGERAFGNCFKLTSTTIPNRVTSIGARALMSFGLTNITIPGNIVNITDDVFTRCPVMETIELTGTGNDRLSGKLVGAFKACIGYFQRDKLTSNTSVASRNTKWKGESFGTIKIEQKGNWTRRVNQGK